MTSKVKTRFEKEADSWNARYSSHWKSIVAHEMALRRQIVTKALSKLSKRNARVLEIGCGSGDVIYEVIRNNPRYSGVGVDISASMIAKARRVHQHRRIKYQCLDIEKNAPAGRFEAVILLGVVGYLGNARGAFARIEKLLSRNGILIFTYGNRESLFRRLREWALLLYPKRFHFRSYHRKDIVCALPKNLEIIGEVPIGFASGLFGQFSVLQSLLLEKLFKDTDPCNLSITRLVILRKK